MPRSVNDSHRVTGGMRFEASGLLIADDPSSRTLVALWPGERLRMPARTAAGGFVAIAFDGSREAVEHPVRSEPAWQPVRGPMQVRGWRPGYLLGMSKQISGETETHEAPFVRGTEPNEPTSVGQPRGMVPARAHRRTKVERGLMRLVATAGIVAVAVVLGAILASQDVAGWIIGLVIGLVTVTLAALLWSSREL